MYVQTTDKPTKYVMMEGFPKEIRHSQGTVGLSIEVNPFKLKGREGAKLRKRNWVKVKLIFKQSSQNN